MYWWAYPSRIVLFLLLPMYLGCSAIDAGTFAALYKQPVKYIEGEAFWFGLAGLLTFALGCWQAEPRNVPKLPSPHISPSVVNQVLVLLYAVVLATYALFLWPVLSHPDLVRDLASGSQTAMFDLRETLNHIPGITSLMALQSLCIVLHVGYSRLTGVKAPERYRMLMVALIIACILRAWLWSERIALMELALPAVILKVAIIDGPIKRWLVFAPLMGFIGAFLMFSFGEYFRSWQFYQYSWDGSFIGFAWVRFVGYFATSLNNGALTMDVVGPLYFPTNTAEWFYKLPFWSLFGVNFDMSRMAYEDELGNNILKVYANAEYNNPGGIFMPFYDYGYALGTLCWLVLGLISGGLFRRFVNRGLTGLLLYPVWYIGVLEVLRIFYWGDSRFFPVLVTGLILAAYLNKQRYPISATTEHAA